MGIRVQLKQDLNFAKTKFTKEAAPIILKTKMDISEKLILFDFVHMQCDYNYYFLFIYILNIREWEQE